MRKRFLVVATLVAAFAANSASPGVFAEEKQPAATTAAPAPDTAKEKQAKIMELLFANKEELTDATIKQARDLGATEQDVLEARAFRGALMGTGDFAVMAAQFEAAQKTWDYEAAKFLKDESRNKVVLSILRARDAMAKGDDARFQTEVSKGIWEDPRSGFLFFRICDKWCAKNAKKMAKEDGQLPAMDKAIASGDEAAVRKAFEAALWVDSGAVREGAVRKLTEWRKANLRLPLDVKFERVGGDAVSLAELLKGKKAVLLDFHASWCGPCMAMLPGLVEKDKELGPQGVVVVAFNTENLDDAKKIQEKFKFTLPVLVEKGNAYSRPLGVDSIPRYVLVGAAGEVLFDGHPRATDKLGAALAKLGVKL